MTPLRPIAPEGGERGKAQLDTSSARLALLAREPVSQGRNEVVVRELIVGLTRR